VGRSIEWKGAAYLGDSHIFFENTGDKIFSIVHDNVNVPVDRVSLGSGRVKLAQWSHDLKFEGRGTLLLEFSKLGKGMSTFVR